jgi:hypothetical protein
MPDVAVKVVNTPVLGVVAPIGALLTEPPLIVGAIGEASFGVVTAPSAMSLVLTGLNGG